MGKAPRARGMWATEGRSSGPDDGVQRRRQSREAQTWPATFRKPGCIFQRGDF